MAETYKYYPHGDRDPKTRNERVDLIREGHKWRFAGSDVNSELPADYLLTMRQNIEAGWGRIQRTNEIGHVIQGGRADLLKWTEGVEKGGGHR